MTTNSNYTMYILQNKATGQVTLRNGHPVYWTYDKAKMVAGTKFTILRADEWAAEMEAKAR